MHEISSFKTLFSHFFPLLLLATSLATFARKLDIIILCLPLCFYITFKLLYNLILQIVGFCYN